MANATVGLHEAKASLSTPVERAAGREEIEPGGWKGEVWVADDFDEPLLSEILEGLGPRT